MSMRLFALVALAISGYLAYVSYQGGTVVGCGGFAAADCDHVLKSRWARVLNVPVSVLAAALYGSILLLACVIPRTGGRKKAVLETLLLAAALAAVGAGVYYFILQIAVVGKFCLLCLAVHTCGLTVAGLAVFHAASYRVVDHSKLSSRYGSIALGLSHKPHASSSSTSSPSSSSPAPDNARPNTLFAVAAPAIGLSLLITAQILFKSKTFEVVDLDTEIRAGEIPNDPLSRKTSDAISHRTLRLELPTDVGATSLSGDANSGSRVGLPRSWGEVSRGNPDDDAKEELWAAAAGPRGVDELLGDTQPRFERYINLFGASQPIDLEGRPRLGLRSAPNVVIKIFDYTCHHCRDMHRSLSRAEDRYGNQMAVVLFPMPLGKECNKGVVREHPDHKDACRYAKLALAVWITKPAEFEAYHEWLMHGQKAPPLSEAADKAIAIVGRDALRTAIRDPEVERQLQENIALFAATRDAEGKSRGLPVMIVGRQAVFGVVAADALFPILERQLKMKPSFRESALPGS